MIIYKNRFSGYYDKQLILIKNIFIIILFFLIIIICSLHIVKKLYYF